MASLSIRNLSEETVARLKAQAKHDGRSMEDHVRRILDRAAEPWSLVAVATEIFGNDPDYDEQVHDELESHLSRIRHDVTSSRSGPDFSDPSYGA